MYNKNQKGFTVFGLVVTVVVIVLIAFFLMKVFPVFAEYRTTSRVISYAAQGRSESEVRQRYDSQIRVEGVNNPALVGRDLKVTVVGNKTTVNFVYMQEVALIGDSIFLLFKFDREISSASVN